MAEERRRRAAAALAAYYAEGGVDDDPLTAISDLLADLLHLAEAHAPGAVASFVVPIDLMSRACDHYLAETS